jgi:hypothetical protein
VAAALARAVVVILVVAAPLAIGEAYFLSSNKHFSR